MLDVVVAGAGVLVQQRLGLHDQTGGAEAALRRAVDDKRLLERVQRIRGGVAVGLLPLGRHTLDGEHLGVLRLKGGVDARIHALAVDDDGTRAAFGLVAADLGPGQPQVIAQHLGQKAGVGHVQAVTDAVDSQGQEWHRVMVLWLFDTPRGSGGAGTGDGAGEDAAQQHAGHLVAIVAAGAVFAGA